MNQPKAVLAVNCVLHYRVRSWRAQSLVPSEPRVAEKATPPVILQLRMINGPPERALRDDAQLEHDSGRCITGRYDRLAGCKFAMAVITCAQQMPLSAAPEMHTVMPSPTFKG